LLDEEFARNAGIKLDQVVQLLTPGGSPYPHVIGFYKSRGAASMAEGSPVLMPLLAAQHFFKSPSKVDSVQIVLKPDADDDAVREEISNRLPTGVSVHAP